MNKPKSILCLIAYCCCMGLSGLGAQSKPWPHAGSDLPVDDLTQWGVLPNGIRYVVMPWNEPPERISLRLLVESGSVNESDRQKGLAHTIEHMAFNGTRNFSAGEMVEYFQRLGMDFGADTNAHTWWRETVYKLELPNSEEALLRDGLRLLRDYADGILFDEEEVEKEKGVVLSELRDRSGADFQSYLDGLKFALPDSRLSGRITIGDADVIRMATRQDLVDYYNKWYTPDRMVVIAVGDLRPESMVDLIDEYFGGMEPVVEPVADPDLGDILPVEVKSRFYSDEELPNGTLEIYTRHKIGPRVDKVDHRLEETRLALGNAILSRRLEKLSKEAEAPFSRGSGYGYRWLDFVQYQGVSLVFEPRNWEACIDLATQELNRAIEFGFTEAELAEAKAKLINGLEEAASRAATRKSRDLSSALVRSVRDGEVFMDPEDNKNLFVPLIEAIGVDEVSSAFQQAWAQEERMINLSGNFEQLVSGKFMEAATIEVEPPEQEEQAPWAYTSFGAPGTVVSSTLVEDLGIRQLILSNGVRLNLKTTDYEANKVYVMASFGDGKLSAPGGKPGLPLMAGAIFTAGGLGQHSADEITALTAGKTVGVAFNVEDNQFTLGGITNEEDLLLQLQLLAAYLSDPGFRPEGERLFGRQLDGLYSQLAHEPMAILQNEVARFLANGDQRFGFPEREELESRTTAEVAEWLSEALSNDYLELSVVGDFSNAGEVIEKVLSTVGALPERVSVRPELVEARQVAFPEVSGTKVFTYETESPRAMATVNWPTTDQDDIFVVRRLSVLGSVVSDRMRVKIREEIGEAYSPYAYNASSDTYNDYGVLRALAGVQPDKADLVQGILVDIGRDLAQNGISGDELVRAIEPIKNQIEEYRRTNRYWTNSVLLRSQSDPIRLEWARSFEGFWETVTVEEVNELAARYLDPEFAIPVQVQPR